MAQVQDSATVGEQFKTFEEFQRANPRLFKSPSSLDWFARKNRAELVNAGALLTIAGRLYIDPARFGAALGEIGKKRSRAAA